MGLSKKQNRITTTSERFFLRHFPITGLGFSLTWKLKSLSRLPAVQKLLWISMAYAIRFLLYLLPSENRFPLWRAGRVFPRSFQAFPGYVPSDSETKKKMPFMWIKMLYGRAKNEIFDSRDENMKVNFSGIVT